MAHEIFNEMFLGHREPAWHRLGMVTVDPVSAVEGYQLIGGYDVRKFPLYYGNGVDAGVEGIARVENEAPAELFATVSPEYEILPPDKFPAIWDMATEADVETMFVLRGGRFFGISTKLDEVDVKGDQITRYLLALNTFDGQTANKILLTPVRVVCQNTLIMGMDAAEVDIRLYHRHNGQMAATAAARAGRTPSRIEREFYAALRHAWDEVRGKADAIQEAMEILANAPVGESAAKKAFARVYPIPKKPKSQTWKAGIESGEQRQEREIQWALNKASAETTRETVFDLFDASPTQTRATLGTAWGIYNAVVEYEDYVRDGKNRASSAEAALFGYRAANKKKAFKVALEVARS